MDAITLKHLRYFEALAAQGHFGRAAETCAISQPALSMQIKELEALVGQPLFERGARQVRLTEFGRDFAGRARAVLQAVEDLSDMARAASGQLDGRVNIGVIPTIAPYLLPRLIGALRQEYPGLDLHVRETITPRLIDELLKGRLDAAIVALPVDEPALVEVPLFSEDFVLVRPAAASGLPPPDREALRRERLLLLEEGHCFRDQALSFCDVGASGARDGLDGTSLSTLVQMVGAGMGMTLIPEMAIPVESRQAEVDIARFNAPAPGRTIGMIWRRSTPLADQLSDLARIVGRVGTGESG